MFRRPERLGASRRAGHVIKVFTGAIACVGRQQTCACDRQFADILAAWETLLKKVQRQFLDRIRSS
jgi:hypothetical protein